MNTLLIKLMLMPIVMAIVSYTTKKWGPMMAGIISCLPWVAGPILIFIAIEQGALFAAHTIPGVMIGIWGWLTFCFVYAYLGRRYDPIRSCIGGYIGYTMIALVFRKVPEYIGLNATFGLIIGIITMTLYFFPRYQSQQYTPLKVFRYDLPMRMLASTGIVLFITYLARFMGPVWSGILTPIPVITAVLAMFTHYTQGMEHTISLFKGLLIGIYGFTVFLFLQAYLLPSTSIFYSFMAGILANILLTLLVRWIVNKVGFFT